MTLCNCGKCTPPRGQSETVKNWRGPDVNGTETDWVTLRAKDYYARRFLVTDLPEHAITHIMLAVDRESFDALKELLWKKSQHPIASEESPAHRRDREALKRVFDQIRNVMYSDV